MTTDQTTSAESAQLQQGEVIFPHPDNYKDGPFKLSRNKFGLLQNVDYKFTPEGFVSWREMINPKFLYPNKSWFERNNKEVPTSIDGLEDYQLLCKLGGYKELARLRGYKEVTYRLERLENGVAAICGILWEPNYETDNTIVLFESTANSTADNCGDFMALFKETQAENRAFVRAVRNFLNINIVGDDEISKGKIVHEELDSSPQALNPQHTLEQHAKKKGFNNWSEFTKFLIAEKYEKLPQADGIKRKWNGFADVPAADCTKLINLLIK